MERKDKNAPDVNVKCFFKEGLVAKEEEFYVYRVFLKIASS